MTEQASPEGPRTAGPQEALSLQQGTGAAAVDRILDELDGLEDRPLEDHLPAFERAHASLRAALDEDLEVGPGPDHTA